MKNSRTTLWLAMAASLITAGTTDAAVVVVNANIAASTTWTNNNTYEMVGQIYVLPGATLTIEPGTVIASDLGSLAITRGAKIVARGTKRNPIIFTSKTDVYGTAYTPGAVLPNGAPYTGWAIDGSHPTGRDPKTGAWRQAATEWGNITIMGRGYVNNRKNGPGCTAPDTGCTNSETCAVANISRMEGLTGAVPNDPNIHYGGADDNDDSGVLEYISFRYGGRVLGLGDELNGLSLGGIGRDTEINFVEIMNNVDDGIEIWGGTVNLKHVSIWNIGDDSFDVDQGWRGKAQFGLVVQGYSVNAAQGSGVGDNIIEIDGAERADDQPVTTCTLYNFTLIGQPIIGDQAIEYADGARLQFRSSVVMDVGERVIRNRGTDGEGSGGYAFNGSLSFMATWATPYNIVPPHVNDCAVPGFHAAQSLGGGAGQGFLNEVTDTVYFRNLLAAGAYSNAAPNEGSDAVGVTIAGGSNAAKCIVVAPYVPATPDLNMPIAGLVRGAPVALGVGIAIPVAGLDPRAANAALVRCAPAPNDGFFTPSNYRGAFDANENWLCKWTAAQAFGFLIAPPGGCETRCVSDLDGNGTTGTPDLLMVINAWGACPPDPCPADIAAPFRIVSTPDLLGVINGWGVCPP